MGDCWFPGRPCHEPTPGWMEWTNGLCPELLGGGWSPDSPQLGCTFVWNEGYGRVGQGYLEQGWRL
jgi:hypothetical protein